MKCPCQIHDHRNLRDLEYMDLEAEKAQCSPCSVDVLGLEETEVHVKVQYYKQREGQEEAELGQYPEYADLPDVVQSDYHEQAYCCDDSMILHDLDPAVVGQEGSRREYGQYRYEHKKENDYPDNLVSFHIVYQFPEAFFRGLRACVHGVVHILTGFLPLP